MATTFDQIKASYPRTKAEWIRLHCPYSHRLQPISMRAASVCVDLGIRANTVTAFAWLVLGAALGLIATSDGDRLFLVFGAGLLSVVTVLDNVDGHVARCTGTSSRAGELMDDALTWFHLSLLPLCLGVALYRAAPEWSGAETWWSELGPLLWPALGAARSVAYLLMVVGGRKTEQLLGSYESRLQGRGLFGAAKAVAEYEAVLLVAVALLDLLWLHHLFYALFYVAALIFVAAQNLWDAFRMDRAEAPVEPRVAGSLPKADRSR